MPSIRPTGKDIVEIFGYAPDDLTPSVRSLWNLGACPFTNRPCSKTNHDSSVVYGTCSVTTSFGDCVICPSRFYENCYEKLKEIALDAFTGNFDFLLFDEYIRRRDEKGSFVVALGQNSGKEMKIGRSLSMDWVLARLENGILLEYVGIEVQSIDITNNYRDCWYAYKNLAANSEKVIPASEHGLNWANVHKRLIPQIIRKGLVYASSNLVKAGLYFIVPDVVYKKFEEIIGSDIPHVSHPARDTLTIFTYALSELVQHGKQRSLLSVRKLRVKVYEFARRFISGVNLPSGGELDEIVKRSLGCG